MEQNTRNSLLVKALIFIGGLLSLNFIISMLFPFIGFLMSIAIIVGIVAIMYSLGKKFRDTVCDGVISYGKAFGFLFETYFLGGIVAAFVMFLYFQFISPDYLSQALSAMMPQLESMFKLYNVDSSEIYDLYLKVFKPLPYSCVQLIAYAIVSVFWSVILAAFIRKDKPIFS
ncbi:MAG: DUF4199 domain-containing protein [Paludibacter sp.]|jgi:hypothetical protein|nr:DUF4199 domain-containing protein [Paludibacter sp.]